MRKYIKKHMRIKPIIILCAALFSLFYASLMQAQTITYTYDNLNRLTGMSRSDGKSIAYTYDDAGNVTQMTSNVSVDSPVAEFTATPLTGPAPLTVNFTDESTGTITSRSWTFGNGATSTEQNPVHIYTNSGTYTVRLTVSDGSTPNTKTMTDYITVTDTTPDAFHFDDQIGAGLGASITSNTIAISGLGTGVCAPISINGGAYKINGEDYTSDPGCVVNGDTVIVRITASGNYSTTINLVLTIGGASDTLSVTTLAEPCNPPVKVNSTYYETFDAAYSVATGEYPIRIQDVELTGDVFLNSDITATLKGGYNCLYDDSPRGYTTINGKVTINKGTVIIENIKIK